MGFVRSLGKPLKPRGLRNHLQTFQRCHGVIFGLLELLPQELVATIFSKKNGSSQLGVLCFLFLRFSNSVSNFDDFFPATFHGDQTHRFFRALQIVTRLTWVVGWDHGSASPQNAEGKTFRLRSCSNSSQNL